MKNPVKIVDFRQKNAKFGGDLIGSGEISLDLDEISLELLDKSPKYENLLPKSENLKSESGKSRRILEIFCWKFLVHRLDRVFSGFGEENRDQAAGVSFWNK